LQIDEIGVNVNADKLTKDVYEDEVGNLINGNCCDIDTNDDKLVGIITLK